LIVAELSGNHNQSMERALKLIEEAAHAGVDAVKLQTYTAETMTLDLNRDEFTINDPANPWHGNSLFQLYEQAHTPWEWHPALFKRCRELGILCFSTPFDDSAVDFLESLDVPCYKIASFEMTCTPLLKTVAQTGKPVIISTGMADFKEITDAVETIRGEGNSRIVILKCTSSYPSLPEQANLLTMRHLHHTFGLPAGLSDHSMGYHIALAATALGACLIEKHFTLNRKDGGVDSAFSMEPSEMAQLVSASREVHRSLGTVRYGLQSGEKAFFPHRRSLYICEDMRKGDILNTRNLRPIRPGFGLHPKHYELLLGKTVARDVTRGTPASLDLIEKDK
jgi:N-acetylneuraminate synthase